MIRVLFLYVLVIGVAAGAYLVGRNVRSRNQKTADAIRRIEEKHAKEVKELEDGLRYWSGLGRDIDAQHERKPSPNGGDVTD